VGFLFFNPALGGGNLILNPAPCYGGGEEEKMKIEILKRKEESCYTFLIPWVDGGSIYYNGGGESTRVSLCRQGDDGEYYKIIKKIEVPPHRGVTKITPGLEDEGLAITVWRGLRGNSFLIRRGIPHIKNDEEFYLLGKFPVWRKFFANGETINVHHLLVDYPLTSPFDEVITDLERRIKEGPVLAYVRYGDRYVERIEGSFWAFYTEDEEREHGVLPLFHWKTGGRGHFSALVYTKKGEWLLSKVGGTSGSSTCDYFDVRDLVLPGEPKAAEVIVSLLNKYKREGDEITIAPSGEIVIQAEKPGYYIGKGGEKVKALRRMGVYITIKGKGE